MISYGASPPHDINMKGHDRLRHPQCQKYNLPLCLSSNPIFSFPNPNCCSSLIPAAFEGDLAGLPTLD
jgi:hypothetical protein